MLYYLISVACKVYFIPKWKQIAYKHVKQKRSQYRKNPAEHQKRFPPINYTHYLSLFFTFNCTSNSINLVAEKLNPKAFNLMIRSYGRQSKSLDMSVRRAAHFENDETYMVLSPWFWSPSF